jgi:ubiquinone/menaquinone biosynthesis C-methylase UbiE
MAKSNSLPPVGHYNANYGNFQSELYAQIRRDAFGEDIGQNSWLTSDEQDRFLEWLDLSSGKTLLDVACGAGGPALRIAAATGCSVIGIDVHEQAVTTASLLAIQLGLVERAEFRVADATRSLPFSDATFDAITCIDAINHFPDRAYVIADWARLLTGERLAISETLRIAQEYFGRQCCDRPHSGMGHQPLCSRTISGLLGNLLIQALDLRFHRFVHRLQPVAPISGVWHQRQDRDLGLSVIAP